MQDMIHSTESFPQENLGGQIKMLFKHGNKSAFRGLDSRIEKTFAIPFS